MSLSQADLDWFAARLSIAVYDTKRESPEMSVYELKEALKDIPGIDTLTVQHTLSGNDLLTIGDRTLEIGPTASHDEIRLALQNPFIRTENTKMSISGYEPGAIRDKLNALKARTKQKRDDVLAKLDAAGSKHEAVSGEMEKMAAQMEKEADAALHELAEFTNGAPA